MLYSDDAIRAWAHQYDVGRIFSRQNNGYDATVSKSYSGNPSDLVIVNAKDNNITAVQGTEHNLECRVTSGKPCGNITWSTEGAIVAKAEPNLILMDTLDDFNLYQVVVKNKVGPSHHTIELVSAESDNSILSMINSDIDVVPEEHTSTSSDNDSDSSEYLDDGYEKPYTTLVVAEDSHVYLTTKQKSDHANVLIPFQNVACGHAC
ncbi:unnamed protein product [Mytilus edulis]|uniref:Ig-like domain-containing protein n=1 Tax=Mytilus edulis TaxID=6550 RepID=A0A8S3QIZ0_MYTED|nr:unnamed protein product [Mytilus edulis]